MNRWVWPLLASGAVGGLVVCTQSTGSTTDGRRPLLESWGERVIMPTYRAFELEASVLAEKSGAFCTTPSAAALQEARDAWRSARSPWKQAEVFSFGPHVDVPLRLGPKIDTWPARIDSIEEVLADSAPIDGDALGSTQKGFVVIEYLLFQPDVDVEAEFAALPRRCTYLLATTQDLALRAELMRQAWDPEDGNYLAELTQAGQGSEAYPSVQLAVSELANRMVFTLENMQRDKLGKPLGNASGGSPQPTSVESPFSQRSIDDLRDNLLTIERLYFGDGGLGLDDFAKQKNPAFTQLMTDAFAMVRLELDAIDTDLADAVVNSPVRVERAFERLGDMQRLVQVDIIGALGLTPSFNDNDGD